MKLKQNLQQSDVLYEVSTDNVLWFEYGSHFLIP